MKQEYTQKDFSFISLTPNKIQTLAASLLNHKKKVYAEVKDILPESRTFVNTILALDKSGGDYEDSFHFVSLLGELSPKQEVRDVVHAVITDLGEKMVDLEYDPDLYISALEYYEGNYVDEKKKLRKEDIKLVEESLREYRRAGFDKDTKTQKEIKKLLKKIGILSQQFGKAINDYKDYILCTEKELDGLSDEYKASLPKDAKSGKYMVTLAYPHLFPFLEQATSRSKRKELAEKNLRKGGKKNQATIKDIIALRAKLAALLGYKHHADYRTENRMAKNGKTVEKFLQSLVTKVQKGAKRDMKELEVMAKKLDMGSVEYYDIGFLAHTLKKEKYDVDDEMLRSYFPLPHVREQMFSLAQKLFGVEFVQKEMKLWHKDAVLYEVRNEQALGGDLVGYLAMDLYPREGKFGHAACMGTIEGGEKEYKGSEMITPLATIMCNFRSPQKSGKTVTPSLLSIGEVETFFHEFGHSLHHILSEAKHTSFAGTNVAWDFVETPSQFMENFVWNKDALLNLSSHYKTEEKLSADVIQKLLASKKFQNGYFLTRQLIHGIVDLELHTGVTSDPAKRYIELNKKYTGISLPEKSVFFPAAFGHLVGYDAGYYSYLWALVYAQDAYSLFDGKKDQRSVGMRWRREVLSKGSSEDELVLLTKFLKRAPNEAAFLKELGL